MHPTSQLAFDLDDLAPAPPPVADRPPEDLPDLDRAAAAVQKLAVPIARYHAAGEPADDHQ